jgi:hypothetical protein
MVINKYYLSFYRMEYQANLLWIPKDSPYNLNEVCIEKVAGNEKGLGGGGGSGGWLLLEDGFVPW